MLWLPDLSETRQIAIWCATLCAALLLLRRAAMVFVGYRHRRRHYPAEWTSRQVNLLQSVLTCIGVVLLLTWIGLVVASPYFPPRYPFSQSRAWLLIGLLIQTYAFLAMVAPHDLNGSPIARVKFSYVLGGAVAWWVIFLGVTIYLIVGLSAPNVFPRQPVVPASFADAMTFSRDLPPT
jgi:hypothetical protein